MPINLEDAQQQHRNFREVLKKHGCEVYTVREILAMNFDDDLVAKVELQDFAMKRLKYRVDPLSIKTMSENDMYYLSDAYKRSVIEKMAVGQLIEVIMSSPTITLRKADRNTALIMTDVSCKPLGNMVFTRDQQITTIKGIVMGNLNSPQRRDEVDVLEFSLRKLGLTVVGRLHDPLHLEGGDFIPVCEGLSMCGVGLRSNTEALLYMAEQGWLGEGRVAAVKDVFDRDQDRMHLDCLGPDSVVSVGSNLGYPVEDIFKASALIGNVKPNPDGQTAVVMKDVTVKTFDSATPTDDKKEADGRFAAMPAARAIRNINAKDLKTIRLLDGTTITCTPDHRILVVREGKTEPEWVPAADLVETDRVVMGTKPITQHRPPVEHLLAPVAAGPEFVHAVTEYADITKGVDFGTAASIAAILPVHLSDVPRVAALARLAGYSMATDRAFICGEEVDAIDIIKDIRCVMRDPALSVDVMVNTTAGHTTYTVIPPAALDVITVCPPLWSAFPAWVTREALSGIWGGAGTVDGLSWVVSDVSQPAMDALHARMASITAMLERVGIVGATVVPAMKDGQVTGYRITVPEANIARFDDTIYMCYAAQKRREQAVLLAWHRYQAHAKDVKVSLPEFKRDLTVTSFMSLTRNSPYSIATLAMPIARIIDVPAASHPFSYDISVNTEDDARMNFTVDAAVIHNCKINMVGQTRDLMARYGAKFLATGEVLGQRPMSQHGAALNHIKADTHSEEYLLRPLCAQLLDPTKVELDGLVDRSRLLKIQGRGRKDQMELAAHYKIPEELLESPGGGCRLTEKVLGTRYGHVLTLDPGATAADFRLCNVARHFFKDTCWLVVGRHEQDNLDLMQHADPTDYTIALEDHNGPYCVGRPLGGKEWSDDDIASAAAFVASYSKGAREVGGAVRVSVTRLDKKHLVEVVPGKDAGWVNPPWASAQKWKAEKELLGREARKKAKQDARWARIRTAKEEAGEEWEPFRNPPRGEKAEENAEEKE